MDKTRLRGLGTVLLLSGIAACGGENLFTEPGSENGGDGNTGTIRGQVTSAGVGVGNVRIILVDRDSVLTDGQGQYQFANLPAATYSVSLRVPANYTLTIGENSTQTREVSAGGIATANWTLQQEVPTTGNRSPSTVAAPR